VDDFVLFVAVGFAAQMVDGAVGMAYGLSGTSVLLSFGIPPATASASVHAAEVFTTGFGASVSDSAKHPKPGEVAFRKAPASWPRRSEADTHPRVDNFCQVLPHEMQR
jgi:uncharacterized membrane protein YfcA